MTETARDWEGDRARLGGRSHEIVREIIVREIARDCEGDRTKSREIVSCCIVMAGSYVAMTMAGRIIESSARRSGARSHSNRRGSGVTGLRSAGSIGLARRLWVTNERFEQRRRGGNAQPVSRGEAKAALDRMARFYLTRHSLVRGTATAMPRTRGRTRFKTPAKSVPAHEITSRA